MLGLHALFVALLTGTEAFFTALAVLNVRHGERTVKAEASWVREALGVEDPDRLLSYNRAKTGTGLLRGWVGVGVLLLVLYSGALADVVALLETVELSPIARGVLFFVAAALALRVVGLPFDAFDAFVVEELFDFNERTVRLWLRDVVLGSAITVVFVSLVGGAILAALYALPDLWWIVAWGVVVAFSVAMLVIYPRVIAPLFNDFEPVDEGDLRSAIEEVFDRAGFSTSGIYVMDASRRSSHSNAYFVGFGRTKRVVLFDTLIEQMEIPEIQGVLAHELAHWKRHHVWKRLAGSAVRVGITLFVLQYLVASDWLYAMFGLPTAPYAGLVVGGLWLYPILRLTAPVENRLSIGHEREADAFAVRVMDEGRPLADALKRLAGENLSNPFPHPAYAAFHYTHPPIPDRIRFIRERADAED